MLTWFRNNFWPIRPKTFEEFISLLHAEGCTKVTATAAVRQERRFIERWGDYEATTSKGLEIIHRADYEIGGTSLDHSQHWWEVYKKLSIEARDRRIAKIPDISVQRLTRFTTTSPTNR